jgi:hypothetical protein
MAAAPWLVFKNPCKMREKLRFSAKRAKGVEPSTASLEGCDNTDVSIAGKEDTVNPDPACTNACTRNPENEHGTPADAGGGGQAEGTAHGAATPPVLSKAEGLETLAQAIANLSADDRARLAAMLAQANGRPARSKAEGKDGNP